MFALLTLSLSPSFALRHGLLGAFMMQSLQKSDCLSSA
jgi:hypothetical protein